MFQNLNIIIRRQKRLILIFLLTIFLPSVTLSIFGLIALRNEKYRLEQQFRENQLDLVNSVKTKISQQLGELEQELQYLVRTPSFLNRDYEEINTLLENHLDENLMSEQLYVAFSEMEPWFPPFRGEGSGYIPTAGKQFSIQQKQQLEQAERYEFIQKNYPGAIALLEKLLESTDDRNLRAQLLNHIARNHMKQNSFNRAISIYTEIIRNYPDTRTSTGTLLPVTVQLQLVDCYLKSGMKEEALDAMVNSFKELDRNSSNLSENQFSAYASIARENFRNFQEEYPEMVSSDTSYAYEFKNLNRIYQKTVNKWQVIGTLKNECITDISEDYIQNEGYTKNGLRYTKTIGTEDFLILSSQIPDETETLAQGIAGIRISNAFLKDSILTSATKTTGWDADDSLTVTDMSGNIILGYETTSPNLNRITSLFDNNFPPWRIEVSGNQTRPFLFSAMFKSYYLWTILAMMAILGFGIVIIGRTISHEKEVLKLKSDFVSSVSHEFKTPITSIKALTERLLEGTVKDEERMKEYYAVIAQDTENLSHLIGNILETSKMEEGKAQYDIVEINFKEWLEETITNFFSGIKNRRFDIHNPETGPSIRIEIDKNAMKLAINNLLDNALKFSSEDSVIRVTHDKQGNRLMLKIMDDGIGIPRNEQAKIFEKFYRAKNALDHSSTGTGLGLTIVKQIVEAHGGEILVESESGKGSAFIILLPLFT